MRSRTEPAARPVDGCSPIFDCRSENGIPLSKSVCAPRWAWVCAGAVLLLFLGIVAGYTVTRSPWWDEGVFADVAMSFRNHGHLGSSLLAPYSYNTMPGVRRYTYWQFPLYLVSLGAWFRILPPTIEAMRLFSVLWACVYIGAWFLFVRALSRNETLAILISSIVALDCVVVANASQGRMESMCAALGQAALASYACLRERNRRLAFVFAGCFGAASLFCHPMGAVTNAFLAVLLLRDWRRLRWSDVAVLSLPYLAGGALCAWYVAQAPGIFVAQYKASTGYRVSGLTALLTRESRDLAVRYLNYYVIDQGRLKPFALLFGLTGFAAVAFDRRLRSLSLGRFFLVCSCVGLLGVAYVDNQGFWYYLIYSVPMLEACAAIWLYEAWRNRWLGRFLATGLLAGSLATTISAFVADVRRDTYKHSYEPAIMAIKRYLQPAGVVMAPSEFGFALGWGPPLIDDCYLGHASGIQPDVYVMHNCCDPGRYKETHRAWTWSRERLARGYQLVETENTLWPYWIYVRKDLLSPVGSHQTGERAKSPRPIVAAGHSALPNAAASASARRSRS